MTNTHREHRRSSRGHWGLLLPILALSPLALAPKGCDNSGVIGDNCPTVEDCPTGAAGESGDAPGESCGGLLGAGCAKDEFCAYPPSAQCGAGDQSGTCRPKPEECDLVYLPVCGCDGKTYGNACSAEAAGVSVAKDGACEGGGGSGETCGGLQGLTCEDGLYCNFPLETKCGSGDQTGTCTPITQGCTKELNEVCGCDDVTYGNPCMAAAVGVSIAHQGPCKPEGVACGEVGGCAADEFCNFPPSSRCGKADGPGVCTKLSPNAVCDTSYAPVCGCDGKTYGNSCEALAAGMSVESVGACDGATCGGLAGTKCQDGFFCDYPLEAKCGSGDQLGQCAPLAEVCTEDVVPVCGCDGKTYSNGCYANRKGVAVAALGACTR